ncbi:MAG: hypothetical protein JXB19_04375 [Bacteroidales bacterium]|nr:hypothetical protein [Bacteroidales bacterium]
MMISSIFLSRTMVGISAPGRTGRSWCESGCPTGANDTLLNVFADYVF